ncbi:MAG TPA: helix-turn-helix transcriptional regulator [Chitinophagales bacterium]|nr:helix-turn-helix transcriptional regulator [Chitinophagales bacterium]
MQHIGDKVKKIRELKNFTQDYVAKQLNMSLANYSKIERDEIQLTIDRLEKFATIFQLKSYLDILTFDEKFFFNIHSNQNGNGYINNYYASNEAIASRIAQLEERVQNLENKKQK